MSCNFGLNGNGLGFELSTWQKVAAQTLPSILLLGRNRGEQLPLACFPQSPRQQTAVLSELLYFGVSLLQPFTLHPN